MSDFKIDFKDPTTWLLAPLLAPLLPFAILGGCEEDGASSSDTDVDTNADSYIADGDSHTCAALDSSGVKYWGSNYWGRLGNGISGENEHKTTPVDVSGLSSGVKAIMAGGYRTCALLAPLLSLALLGGCDEDGDWFEDEACDEIRECIKTQEELGLETLINPDDGDPFNWNVDCPEGVVLTPGTAHDYYCRHMWKLKECEEDFDDHDCRW